MKKAVLSFILVIFAFVLISMVSAIPSLPHNSWGVVSIDGEEADDGIIVEAYINGVKYGETTTINSWYSADVTADDAETAEKDGGVAGDEIILKVNGISTSGGVWNSGTHRLDLSVGSGSGKSSSSNSGGGSSSGGGGGGSSSSSGGGGGGGSGGRLSGSSGSLSERAKESETETNKETEGTGAQKITGLVAKQIEGSASAVVLIVVSIILAVVLVGLLVWMKNKKK